MPPANRDASELTRRKRSMALYTFASANTAAVNAGTSVRREQNAFPTLDIVTLRKQGGCYCAGYYDKNGCNCGGTNF